MSFFKSLFGLFSKPAPPVVSQPLTQPLTSALAPPKAEMCSANPLVFSWREIIDARSRIAGYYLQPSSLTTGSHFSGADLTAALMSEGLQRVIANRLIIVPMTLAQWQGASLDFLRSPNSVAHLLFEPSTREQAQSIVAEIETSGWRLASAATSPPAAPGTRRLVILSTDGASLEQLEHQISASRAKAPVSDILVTGVTTWSEYRYLMAQGVAYCMGSFATTNETTPQSSEISQSRLILLEMLNQLRGDADTSTIVSIAKRDPAVVLKLLEMANSPISGLSRQVATLEAAIQLLGRDLLYRWLALALFRTDAQGFRDETLMSIALSRAAFLEQFAPDNDRKQAGELFLVGLFSLVENLFQQPLEKILARLQLPDTVCAVIARNEGPYAGYLQLSLAMERLKLEQILPLCGQLNLTPGTVFDRYRQAMAWATETAAAS